MNRTFVVLALVALTFVATIGIVGESKFTAQQAFESAPAGPISVTKQAFDAIKSGMSEDDVRKIMGGAGDVQSDRGERGRIKIVSFREGTKVIGVTFRDGRLAGKTQVGL